VKAARFLEKKRVIQFFGWALCIAPFVNLYLFIHMDKLNSNPYTKQLSLFEYLKTGSKLHYFLALMSLLIGGVMVVTGSKKVWKLVLGFLAVHIYIQFQNLGVNIKQSWLWGLFFVVNAALFVFIAEQLVFNIEPIKPKKLPRTQIGFKGYGTWAELVQVNSEGIQVRRLKEPPSDIQNRLVNFKFKQGVSLDAKYSHSNGSEYYFLFKDIKPTEQKELTDWINRHAS
jgi:hypothetical protein